MDKCLECNAILGKKRVSADLDGFSGTFIFPSAKTTFRFCKNDDCKLFGLLTFASINKKKNKKT